jgi:hypothetical protein
VFNLGALVYPTIETTEENSMSKRPHTASRGTEYYIAPKGEANLLNLLQNHGHRVRIDPSES